MKMTFVKVLVVLVLCVVGVGFYRGWFAMSSPTRDTESNKVNINLSMDGDKVKEDAETVKEKATELTGKATEEAKDLGDQATDKVNSE
jgi:cell division protein FtsX